MEHGHLERAIQALRDTGQDIDEKLLPHLSPLGWEHINLTGDYIWQQHKLVEQGKFRPLRVVARNGKNRTLSPRADPRDLDKWIIHLKRRF